MTFEIEVFETNFDYSITFYLLLMNAIWKIRFSLNVASFKL